MVAEVMPPMRLYQQLTALRPQRLLQSLELVFEGERLLVEQEKASSVLETQRSRASWLLRQISIATTGAGIRSSQTLRSGMWRPLIRPPRLLLNSNGPDQS